MIKIDHNITEFSNNHIDQVNRTNVIDSTDNLSLINKINNLLKLTPREAKIECSNEQELIIHNTIEYFGTKGYDINIEKTLDKEFFVVTLKDEESDTINKFKEISELIFRYLIQHKNYDHNKRCITFKLDVMKYSEDVCQKIITTFNSLERFSLKYERGYRKQKFFCKELLFREISVVYLVK